MSKSDEYMTGLAEFCFQWALVKDEQEISPDAAKKLRQTIGTVRELIPGHIKTLARFVGSVDPDVGHLNHGDHVQISMLIEDLAQCLSDAQEASVMLEWLGHSGGEGGGKQ
jgi:hypothetical protein